MRVNDPSRSDYIKNAVRRIADEISKIKIVSVVEKNGVISNQNDEISRLFKYKPNILQTTSDFISSIVWRYYSFGECFIYPLYILKKRATGEVYKFYKGFYPIYPDSYELMTNTGKGTAEIKFIIDGDTYHCNYSEIIHLKNRNSQSIDNFNDIESTTVHSSINALDKTIEEIPKSISAAHSIKGIFNSKSLHDKKELEKIGADLEEHITSSKYGILVTDLTGEFTPVSINPTNIDATTLEFLKSNIQEKYGVSQKILSGAYNSEEHLAFYRTCVEPFITQFEQAFTDVLFTEREKDVGHMIKCYYNTLSYASMTEKIQLTALAIQSPIVQINEIRGMYGLTPTEEGDKFMQDLNHIEHDKALSYQLSKVGVKKEGENEERT